MHTGSSHAAAGPATEPFTGDGVHGEVVSALRPADLVAEVARVTDPGGAIETLHWGRNYLYSARLDTPEGPIDVVVKQFRNQGLRRRLERRLRGSRATRGWRAAHALLAAGVATPAPVLLVESDHPAGPSCYICRRVRDAFEVRHFFRRLEGRPDAGMFPAIAPARLLAQLGAFARRIHDAGVLHRDLSTGNVLARPIANGALELLVVDVNRARTGVAPGWYRRTRDICRFPVRRREHVEAFLGGYWGALPGGWDPRCWLFAVSVRGYLFKHLLKRGLRGLSLPRRHRHGGSHPPHLPAAAPGTGTRDKAVWDRLSDQPFQHASRAEKLVTRLTDISSHAADVALVIRAAPAVRRRYRELRAALYREPVPLDGIGVCVRPYPPDPARHLAAIDSLGVRHVLLRLHPWESDHADEERLAAALAARGLEVVFALPQNRDLVRDRDRWQRTVTELATRFTPYGTTFEIGHAPNRSKWGVWTRREYLELYRDAAVVLRRHPGVQLMGPAVIDFELQATLAIVGRRQPGVHFDIVSSLLYVDRRGAPEQRQLGFDTVGKVALLRAIADCGRCCDARVWITEVNWPLWEGPHSPAGRAAAVDVERQADYLVRYYLLALGSGLVERVFWWRLAARGYGLMVPRGAGELCERPSFEAMRTMIALLAGARFDGPLPVPEGCWLYPFTTAQGRVVVGWSLQPGRQVELPSRPASVLARDGRELTAPAGTTVELGPSPRYFPL